jgi:nicotinamide N-methyltransferase
MENTEDGFAISNLIPEPERPPTPSPTYAVFHRGLTKISESSEIAWTEITIRLVGKHPLWGHYLWNAARSFATFLDEYSDKYCLGKRVLELGAGGGLPGIVACLKGASRVVLTDYPDNNLIKNLEINVERNIPPERLPDVKVLGHIWGRDVKEILEALDEPNQPTGQHRFDTVLLSDLVFNHSEHEALLKTCDATLNPAAPSPENKANNTPCLLVFYTHHRPHLAEKDLEFFRLAREKGWVCEEIVTEHTGPMFDDDSGDEEVRSTVHGWRMYRDSSRE